MKGTPSEAIVLRLSWIMEKTTTIRIAHNCALQVENYMRMGSAQIRLCMVGLKSNVFVAAADFQHDRSYISVTIDVMQGLLR